MLAVVTGASGHVGNVLVRSLLADGHRVRATDRTFGPSLQSLETDQIPSDVLDPESLPAAVRGADIVFHLAGQISLTGDPDGRMWAVNVEGTRNVANAALEAGVSRFVHCSSVHAYDLEAAARGLDESGVRADASHLPVYDRSKAEGERQIRWHVARGLDAVVVNPTGVIGPYDFGPSRMGRIFEALRRGRLPATLAGAFDWVDVRDVAAALINAGEYGQPGSNYLVGGEQLTLAELARLAAEATGRTAPRSTLPMWFARLWSPLANRAARLTGNPMWYTSDSLHALRYPPNLTTRRARTELGHTPRSTADTIGDIYAWLADRQLAGALT